MHPFIFQTLRELDITWSAMNFEYGKHQRTGSPLLKADEELVETLEDNQVCNFNIAQLLTILHAVKYLYPK